LKVEFKVERLTTDQQEGTSDRHHLMEGELTEEIIGAAVAIHRELGPGLLESAYQACMCRELSLLTIPFRSQVDLPVHYKGLLLDCGYRIDLVVNERVVVELKSVERFCSVHEAQLLTYLRLSKLRVGLLINSNVPVLRKGVVRRVL
jgi:GxxExxY protein